MRATPGLAAMAGAIVLLAGCGSSSNSTTTSSGSTAAGSSAYGHSPASTPTTSSAATAPAAGSTSSVSVAANPEGLLKYVQSSVTAKAGKVTVSFTNMSSLSHNLNIESSAGTVLSSTPTFQGGTKSLTLSLKAGTYKFFCSVPGHRMAGMEGTLTVQ